MKKNLNGKIATIVGVLLICLYGILGIPHGVTGGALLDAITQRIHLGLDLRGGAHLILQVVVKDAVNAETDNTVARIQQELQTSKLQGSIQGRPATSATIWRTTTAPSSISPAPRTIQSS